MAAIKIGENKKSSQEGFSPGSEANKPTGHGGVQNESLIDKNAKCCIINLFILALRYG
jgi:hypothetical protein